MIFLFLGILFWVTWKLFIFGLKTTWAIMKLLCFFIPVFILGMFCMGFMYIALPVLIIVGVAALVGGFR